METLTSAATVGRRVSLISPQLARMVPATVALASRSNAPLVRALGTVRVPSCAAFLVGSVPVGGLAAAQGGYFPPAWGWSAVGLTWAGVIALILRRRIAIGRLELAVASALAALGGWIGLSAVWSSTSPQSIFELERVITYVVGVLAVMFLVRRAAVPALLGGLLAATAAICCYALATRLFPDRIGPPDSIGGYRLSTPLGYWNALGLFAAIGGLLALGFAARARVLWVRLLAAASLVILLPTLYFTSAAGRGWRWRQASLQLSHSIAAGFDSSPNCSPSEPCQPWPSGSALARAP